MIKFIQFLLISIALLFSFTLAYSQQMRCKCGEQCKCNKNDKCGVGCTCLTKQGKGQCTCGAGCKCGMGHAMHQMAHENVFLKMMDSMMVDMDAAPLDASAEGNFLRQMIPHHLGAIEMAKYEIDNGKNREMIQLAKSILTEQKGEIAEMNTLLVLYPLKQSEQPSEEYKKVMDDVMMKMMTTGPSDKNLVGKSIDCAFAMVMLPHHQAAVDMARALLNFSSQGQVATYAARIISDQQIEIGQMTEYIKQNCK